MEKGEIEWVFYLLSFLQYKKTISVIITVLFHISRLDSPRAGSRQEKKTC